MDITLFKRRRRTLILVALVAGLIALAFGVAMGGATQSAQAKTRHHRHHAGHAVHRAHGANTDPGTAGNESGAGTESDGPSGPDVQSGSQSGPNDTTGPDTESKSKGSEGESATSESDAPGGSNSNCVDNAGCQ